MLCDKDYRVPGGEGGGEFRVTDLIGHDDASISKSISPREFKINFGNIV